MRFLIRNDIYTKKEPKDGVIPLYSGGRALFLKESAAPLLETIGTWMDFDSFAAKTSNEMRRDLLDGLTLLSCFDIAEIEEDTIKRYCRVAGERDYRRISAFFETNAAKGCNRGFSFIPAYHNEDAVRARQFNNQEYNFLFEENGIIQAVLVIGVPSPESVLNVVNVSFVVFSSELDESACVRCLKELLFEVERAFFNDAAKLRFQYTDPSQDWLLAVLKANGFIKICTLEKELLKSMDLSIYDKKIGDINHGAC